MAAIGRFGPPLAVMGLIFFLSAQPDLSSGLGGWDVLLRKLAHMAVFGTLWLLWLRALGAARPAAWAALAITGLYGISDELHQAQVEGRHGSAVDVGIDLLGAAAAWGMRSRRAGYRE